MTRSFVLSCILFVYLFLPFVCTVALCIRVLCDSSCSYLFYVKQQIQMWKIGTVQTLSENKNCMYLFHYKSDMSPYWITYRIQLNDIYCSENTLYDKTNIHLTVSLTNIKDIGLICTLSHTQLHICTISTPTSRKHTMNVCIYVVCKWPNHKKLILILSLLWTYFLCWFWLSLIWSERYRWYHLHPSKHNIVIVTGIR